MRPPISTPAASLFDLPPTRDDANPPFRDAASAGRWLDDVPLLNAPAANGLLYGALEEFIHADIAPAARFEALELVRPHLVAVQAEHVGRLRGRPLPLSRARREALAEVESLWDVLARAYQRVVESMAALESAPDIHYATACQRALDALSRKLAEHHYAYIAARAGEFRALHRVFGHAERLGLADRRVRDPLARDADSAGTTCERVYVQAMLFEAAMPREHHARALEVIERWIERWAPKVSIGAAGLAEHVASPPLYVDIEADRGPLREPLDTPGTRVLDMGAVASSLDKRIHGIRHGKKPDELGLGEDLSKRDAEVLLVALRRQWCEGPPRRLSERQPVQTLAHVSGGLVAAHFYFGKRPFEQPFSPTALPRRARARGAEPAAERVRIAADYLLVNKIHTEQWIIRDESISGLGLIRPFDEIEGASLVHGILVTVRPRGGGSALLGTVQWLQEAVDGDLHVGVRLIPGVPNPIAARQLGQDKFFPALLLAPIPAMNVPSSVLLPIGSYVHGRTVEIFLRGVDRIQLTGLLEAGTDFERIAFMPASGAIHAAH